MAKEAEKSSSTKKKTFRLRGYLKKQGYKSGQMQKRFFAKDGDRFNYFY